MSEHPTCKDRVRSNYQDRMTDLNKLWDAYASGEENVPDLGNLFEYGLAFDYVAPGTFRDQRRGYFRYQLSWGGPSDEFRFYTDERLHPVRVEYWFMDWYDGARITVREGKAFTFLCELFDWFAEGSDLRKMVSEAQDE